MPLDRSAEDEPMTETQMATLQRLAYEAFEPEAFSRQLSKTEAQRRIDALAAKLRLQSTPLVTPRPLLNRRYWRQGKTW